MTPEESLRLNFTDIGLPADAQDWLIALWHVTQVFDDFADGDAVSRPDLDLAIWESLVKMPVNPFFHANAGTLAPVVATAVLKWQVSDAKERAGTADCVSFVWRAGYYDVVLMVAHLCLGDAATKLDIAKLYGEKLDDYLREFGHA